MISVEGFVEEIREKAWEKEKRRAARMGEGRAGGYRKMDRGTMCTNRGL